MGSQTDKTHNSENPADLRSRPDTTPYFVSDPPGEKQLDGTYFISEDTGTTLELESFQLSTDQNWGKW